MFGLELSDVLMAFCEGKVLFLAATKKAKLLQDLTDKLPEDFPQKLEVLTREKTDADKANFAKIIEALKVPPRPPATRRELYPGSRKRRFALQGPLLRCTSCLIYPFSRTVQ
jgi:hypothetical protein